MKSIFIESSAIIISLQRRLICTAYITGFRIFYIKHSILKAIIKLGQAVKA